jgi:hypothetical protein
MEQKQFARKCDNCNKGMNEGYLVNDSEYYCSDECLHTKHTEKEYKELYEDDNAYYTEWSDDDIDYDDEPIYETNEKKYKVTKERFINWYFSDVETRIDFGNNAIDELEQFGKLNVTIKGLFDTCGYIPSSICEGIDTEDLDEDLEPSDVELI